MSMEAIFDPRHAVRKHLGTKSKTYRGVVTFQKRTRTLKGKSLRTATQARKYANDVVARYKKLLAAKQASEQEIVS